FRIDNTDHIIDVNRGNVAYEYDQINIICPSYSTGTRDDAETYIIYNVSKEEYDSCHIGNKAVARTIAVCDKPNLNRYFTITFRPFTPQPGGLEFRPGQDYYFIALPASDNDPNPSRPCQKYHMKVVFKVCCKRPHQPTIGTSTRPSVTSSIRTTTTTTTTMTPSTTTIPSSIVPLVTYPGVIVPLGKGTNRSSIIPPVRIPLIPNQSRPSSSNPTIPSFPNINNNNRDREKPMMMNIPSITQHDRPGLGFRHQHGSADPTNPYDIGSKPYWKNGQMPSPFPKAYHPYHPSQLTSTTTPDPLWKPHHGSVSTSRDRYPYNYHNSKKVSSFSSSIYLYTKADGSSLKLTMPMPKTCLCLVPGRYPLYPQNDIREKSDGLNSASYGLHRLTWWTILLSIMTIATNTFVWSYVTRLYILW
ncbi:hypothetical protein RDWZM_004439, partial [Blomia tropicalis]